MTRPPFMLRPLDWTRVARHDQTAKDYACAVQHNVKPKTHPADVAMYVLAVVVGIALGGPALLALIARSLP